jgi:di/tripeptidase
MTLRLIPLAVMTTLLVACSAGGGSDANGTGPTGNSGTGGSFVGGGGNSGNGGSLIGVGGSAGEAKCNTVLQVVYRDFDNKTHPDFEMGFAGDEVRRGLVESTLGSDLKPVFKDTTARLRQLDGFPAGDHQQGVLRPVVPGHRRHQPDLHQGA